MKVLNSSFPSKGGTSLFVRSFVQQINVYSILDIKIMHIILILLLLFRFISILFLQGVVTSAVSLIDAFVKKNPEEYKGCVSLAVSRLSRVSLVY